MYFLNYLCQTWSHAQHLIDSSIAFFSKSLTLPDVHGFIFSKLLIVLMSFPRLGALLYTKSAHKWTYRQRYIVLAAVPGFPALVRVGTGTETPVRGTNRQGTGTAQSWGVGYPDRTETSGFLAGLYPDCGSILRFLQLSLQLSIWVLIVSWHDQYVHCAGLVAVSHPAFGCAIRLIFVGWLWNQSTFYAKLAGFQ